jgi:hypothetical protein
MTKDTSGQNHANHDEPLLKNVGKLARALGVSPVFVKRMEWAGFPMPGGRCDGRLGFAVVAGESDFPAGGLDKTAPRWATSAGMGR